MSNHCASKKMSLYSGVEWDGRLYANAYFEEVTTRATRGANSEQNLQKVEYNTTVVTRALQNVVLTKPNHHGISNV